MTQAIMRGDSVKWMSVPGMASVHPRTEATVKVRFPNQRATAMRTRRVLLDARTSEPMQLISVDAIF
jgi:hypothetical protein